MKKLIGALMALLLTASLATPSQAAEVKYSAYQKTLAAYSGSATELSSVQKAQIRATVEKNPDAEKFICTGIRYFDQPMSVNIMVRKRAKEACEYAKLLNPKLSTWYQNKPTKARSYAGKVLLTVKTPIVEVAEEPVVGEDSEQRDTPENIRPPVSGDDEKLPGGDSPNLEGVTWGESLDPSICKLEEDSRMRKPGDPVPSFTGQAEIRGRYAGNATAFPFAPTALPITGDIDVAFIFVDWADLPGTQADYDYFRYSAGMFSEFYRMASENKLNMNMIIQDKWHRLAGSYLDYATFSAEEEAQRGEAPKKQVFYDAVVDAVDDELDFTDIEIVLLAIPTAKSVFVGGPHEFNFDWNGNFRTAERTIYDIAAPGDFNIQRSTGGTPTWSYYVHEVGHMLGIPHQANEDENKPGAKKHIVTPLGGWDVMSEHGGGQRTMTAWLRWLAGWLDDDQIACTTKDALQAELYELTPVNVIGGETEALVIKLSETEAVVVESRRFDEKFDVETGNSPNGLIAYTVDATKASAQGNQVILSPRDITEYIRQENTWPDWRELDAIFFQGDAIVIEGVRIEAHSIGQESDVVKVTRVADESEPTVPRSNLRDLDNPNSVCQIAETQNRFFNAKGFPFQSVLPAVGKVNIAIVPMDFSNAVGVGNPGEMFHDDVISVQKWAEFASGGKLRYHVDLVSDSWIRAPKGAEWYTCTECQKGSIRDLQSRRAAFQELILTADEDYNFTDTDFVYFVFPYEAENKFGTAVYFNSKTAVNTKDGVATLTAYGEMGGSNGKQEWDRARIWEHLVHEILHLQGFVGHGPVNGGNWNIMQNQFGASSTAGGWEQFLAGWLDEDQVLCILANDLSTGFQVALNSIDLGGDEAEIAIIKMSDEEVVVVELRQSGEYSNFEGAFSSSDAQQIMPANPGYTAYRVTPNLPNYRDDSADQAEVEARNWWGYLRDGGNAWITSSISHKGLTLTKLDSQTLGLDYQP